MHCKTEGGTLIRRAASGLKRGVLQYWRNRVKILLRKPGETTTELVQSCEKTLNIQQLHVSQLFVLKRNSFKVIIPSSSRPSNILTLRHSRKAMKKDFPDCFLHVPNCNEKTRFFFYPVFFFFLLCFICNRVFISEPVSTWACLQIDQLYNIGEHFYLPSRLDSLTPLISKSASLSMSSIISCVSLQSCSFTVCLRVSSTSSLSSCVRYFMLSVL